MTDEEETMEPERVARFMRNPALAKALEDVRAGRVKRRQSQRISKEITDISPKEKGEK
jgi:hypothetical protein